MAYANPGYFLSVNGMPPQMIWKWECVEVRRRAGTLLGKLTQTARVFVKPVSTSGVEEYLNLVARDRPESLLP